MKTRGSWGIVYVAIVFAVVAVGIATATYYFEKNQKSAAIVAAGKNLSDWHGISDTISTTTTGGEAPSSEAVSQDLLDQYAELANQGTFTAEERDQMLSELVQKDVSVPAIVPNITLKDLNVQESASLDSYVQLLAVIIAQGGRVKEYELNVFARTVGNEVKTGTPELATDAALYEEIAAALLLMDTPPAVAPQHLEVVKSVGALAKATALLATWNGDPIEGLTYVDAFNKAEAYVTNSVNELFATVATLKKT
jgi:hypothetical protein